MSNQAQKNSFHLSFNDFRNEVLEDYKTAMISRECSLAGRKEVLTGKAKFGILGDGKELPQIAMAKVFRNGDFRSGYYRDQTFMLAIKNISIENYFAQMYAHTDISKEPSSAGRQMNCHFSSKLVNEDGTWINQTQQKNTVSDISPTAGQIPRLLGLALASKIYKQEEALHDKTNFSNQGNEVAFGTIGDASTAEGHFWEMLNAVSALQAPMILSIWDDGYGISVSSKEQRAKDDFAELLAGFKYSEKENKGCEIISVKAWDYPALVDAYQRAENFARNLHRPVIIHVSEVTQPQGHSTSGSHERYKSTERLDWEKEHDCITKFKEWILNFSITHDSETLHIATQEELSTIDQEVKSLIKEGVKSAWDSYRESISSIHNSVSPLLEEVAEQSTNKVFIRKEIENLNEVFTLYKKDIFQTTRKILRLTRGENTPARASLLSWFEKQQEIEKDNYSSHLMSEDKFFALSIPEIPAEYSDESEYVDGRIIVKDNFEKIFETYPEAIAFGEDVGQIGDVNQGFEGLQEKFGKLRIADTGIREATIIGQGMGLAMRGLKPITEIQYLDYVLYGLQTMSDDIASLSYRTKGQQKAPIIVRTRGHRLEGVWHAGSPMGTLISTLRGMCILTPRDMVKAAGFYNTMIQSNDPSIIVECLNGYRLKEKMPSNIGKLTTPVGKIEVTKEGADITVVTYGSTWRIVTEAAKELTQMGIDIEIIDAQSLVPFDISHDVIKSLKKTNKLVVIDEDIPGGASAYLLQKILEEQEGYNYLDSAPKTITAKEHKTAYSSDGDYFCKPSVDDVVEGIYSIMNDVKCQEYPDLF